MKSMGVAKLLVFYTYYDDKHALLALIWLPYLKLRTVIILGSKKSDKESKLIRNAVQICYWLKPVYLPQLPSFFVKFIEVATMNE